MTDLDKSLKVNARLISTETGEVFTTAAIEVQKDGAVCGLIGGCIATSKETDFNSPSRSTLKNEGLDRRITFLLLSPTEL